QATASGTVTWYIKYACPTYVATGNSVVINAPSTANVYTIHAENSNACGATAPLATAMVTIEALPSITAASGTICNGNSFTINPSGAATYSFSSGPVVSPLVNTTYTVFGTSVNGCQNKTTVTVSIAPDPTIAVNNATICNGSSVNLIPSGASTYTYLNGGPVVTPSVSDSYSITGKSIYGCPSTNTAVANIVVLQTPTVSANAGTVCAGTPFVFTPSGAVSYSITGNSMTVSPLSNTSYTIKGAASNGCTHSVVSQVVALPLPTVSIGNGTLCSGDAYTLSPQGAINYSYSSGSPVVNPLSQTSYTITGESAVNGCTAQAVASLSVYPLPVISVSGGTLCEGATFTLNPSGAASYTYSSGSSTVSPNLTTSYSVTGTSSLGCISASAAVVELTVYPNPTISVSSGTICEGNTFTLNPSGAASYTYSSGSSTVSPNLTSSYSITGTSSLGCISASAAVANVTVYPAPIISVNSGTLCEGNTFTLVPSGAITYTYSGGSSTVSPSATTSFSVIGIDNIGCISLNPAVADVTVFPAPVISVNSGTICSGSSFTIIPSGAFTYTYSGNTPVVSPATTSSYSVAGTDVLGCLTLSPAISMVSVLPSPTVSVNNGTICLGEVFYIIPSGADSYTYSSISASVSPLTTTSYTVTGAFSNGCASSEIVNVTVHPLPTLTITGSTQLLCVGEVATLTVDGANSYTWNTNSNFTSIEVSPPSSETFSVTGVDANNCVDTALYFLQVDVCSGYKEPERSNTLIQAYPNPNAGVFSVQSPLDGFLRIVDVNGKLIFGSEVKQGVTQINLAGISHGVYYLMIKGSVGLINCKMIVDPDLR
ncbi:MAG: T9SS type A sorting domain-containing protein, partial [Bacteroidia bacterium]|nr:T9SS type A sorting domain-containing protein [Bacteroidia bacterium]